MNIVKTGLMTMVVAWGSSASAAVDEVTILSAEIDRLQWMLAGVGVLGGLSCLLAIWLTRKLILNKYRLLTDSLCDISTGSRQIDLPASGNDVFGKMCESLHQIVCYIGELEKRLVESENVANQAGSEAREANERALLAREHGEAARCKGLLSAAETLDASIQSIQRHSSQLAEVSAKAQEGGGRPVAVHRRCRLRHGGDECGGERDRAECLRRRRGCVPCHGACRGRVFRGFQDSGLHQFRVRQFTVPGGGAWPVSANRPKGSGPSWA